jgi:hypothetical protein
VLSGLLDHPYSRELSWQFTKAHWQDINPHLEFFGRSYIIGELGNFCDPEHRSDVQQFFVQNDPGDGRRAVDRALEQIAYCIDLKSQQQAKFASWLAGASGAPLLRAPR